MVTGGWVPDNTAFFTFLNWAGFGKVIRPAPRAGQDRVNHHRPLLLSASLSDIIIEGEKVKDSGVVSLATE